MTGVMMFVSDVSDPWALVSAYLAAIPSGSYLSLSHLTDDYKPPAAAEGFRAVFDTATEHMYFRSKAKVERFFAGLDLAEPYPGAEPGRHLHRPVGRRGRGARGQRRVALALLRRRQEAVTGQSAGKPTVAELGIDLAAQAWHRSGDGDGAIEVAFARAASASAGQAQTQIARSGC